MARANADSAAPAINGKMQIVRPDCPKANDWQTQLSLIVEFWNNDNAALAFQEERRLPGELVAKAGTVWMEPDVGGKLRECSAL